MNLKYFNKKKVTNLTHYISGPEKVMAMFLGSNWRLMGGAYDIASHFGWYEQSEIEYDPETTI